MLWDRYAHLGGSLREAVINLLTHPLWAVQQAIMVDRKWYYLLAWRESLLTALPLLAMVFSQNPGQYKLGFHYSAAALPLLYYAFVHGLRIVRERLVMWIPARDARSRVVTAAVAVLVGFNVSQSPSYDLTHIDHEYVAAVQKTLSAIPEGASVAATGALVPQLVNRHLVCYVKWTPGQLCEWGAPAFVVLDLGRRLPEIPLPTRERYLHSLVDGLGYTIVRQQDDLVILHGQERLGAQFAPPAAAHTF